MHAPRSRLAAAITLLFLAGGLLVVVLAVVALARDVRDDAAWAAVVLGVALAAWGVSFHRLGAADDDHEPAERGDAAVTPAQRSDPLGSAAVVLVIAAGSYWLLRGPLDRQVAEAALVAAITLGLWALNRTLDARIRRRRAAGEID